MDDTNALLISTLFEVKQNIGANDAKTDAILIKLDKIEKQTTLTNGRVSALEKWRSYLLGAFAVLTSIVMLAGWVIEVALRAHGAH